MNKDDGASQDQTDQGNAHGDSPMKALVLFLHIVHVNALQPQLSILPLELFDLFLQRRFPLALPEPVSGRSESASC